MYGLDDDEMKMMHDIFAQTVNIDKVILYGSRAKGTYKPFSDVDITLVGDQLTEEDLTDVMFRLDESSLPYFCDVSLFKNLSSPDLISHILRMGKTIYTA
jgi:predicted nucleotidyltransferase